MADPQTGIDGASEGRIDRASDSELKPYKGPDSYQTEDGELFFGREREASQILNLILSSRTTLLHAQSGAGKTSLLNARVIPQLEAAGCLPVRTLPQNDPLAAIRETTLHSGVIHPDLERRAIQRAQFTLNRLGEASTLGEMLQRYDELAPAEPDRRQLLAPLPSALWVGGLQVAQDALVTPFFARLLRGTFSVERYADELAAVTPIDRSHETWLDAGTPVSELFEFLESPEVAKAHEELLEDLMPPIPSLSAFLEQFCWVRSAHPGNLALVLIFDQFEELFTRFVDPGHSASEPDPSLPDWRLRWRFFEEFAELYRARMPLSEEEGWYGPDDLLPVRFVFSMREEYIGQLQPLRHVVRDLDDHAYHLGLLSVESARQAIQEPARLYGYDYTPECYTEIVRSLTKEDRYVEPSHVQIVCEKLWDELGRELWRSSKAGDELVPMIELAQFQAMGGAPQILRSFFGDFMAELPEDEKLDVLELLQSLITGSRTRNIVEHRALVHAPFRDARRRERILGRLVDARIVRIEPRLGGSFIEITHEFLLEPVLKFIQELLLRDPERQGLLGACRILSLGVEGDFRKSTDALLNADQVETVDRFRELLKLTPAALELTLRSAVVNTAHRELVHRWADRYDHMHSGERDLEDLLEQLADAEGRKAGLSGGEWRAVSQVRRQVTDPVQCRGMLRSALRWAEEREREEVVYWIRRCADGG